MTPSEIAEMYKTWIKGPANKDVPLWKTAFQKYSEDTKSTLQMGCALCYFKVMKHFKNK